MNSWRGTGRASANARTCETSGFPEPVVRLKGVGKSYVRGGSSTRVLEDVDLTARPGECIFFVGPSGSGKSTLLSIIGCVLTADCGEVHVMGNNVSTLRGNEAAGVRLHHIGFVFQRFHLIRGLTASENIGVPLQLHGWTAADARRRACELLELVDMSGKRDVHPNRLSVGQCQRVAIARALAADPALILADEPTASLDGRTGQQTLGLLRRLTVDAGRTVIVVTHDPRILPFADRILQLENGRLIREQGGRSDDGMSLTDPVPNPVATC